MKKKDYFIISILVLITLGIIYYIKGFFPFGNNYIIWGDMHSQIVPLYYKFYDAIYHNSSLLIDFSSGGGISLLGIFAYYITSPFTLLVLLFPRDMIVHAPTIIIAIKILLCSITCLYFLRKHFKNVPNTIQILLAFLYAFSTYNLANYIITGWIDVVYLLPLLLSGLKDLIDGKKNKFYFTVLVLSLLMNFYLTFMILLFIILSVCLYFKICKIEKEKQKNIILHLGIMTLLGLLCSCILLIPTFLELSSSIRTSFDLNSVIHSGLGPITDKISYLFMSSIVIGIGIILLYQKRKEKIGKFFFLLLFLLSLPILIEPINKMWHFGSYIYYPLRFGFLFILLFIVVTAYYFNGLEEKEIQKKKKIIIIGISSIFAITCIILSYRYYPSIQNCITNLTFTKEKIGFFVLFFLFILLVISTMIIVLLGNRNKITIVSLWLMAIIMTFSSGLFYFGIDNEQSELKSSYILSNQLYKELPEDIYRVKLETMIIPQNYGMVINKPTLDHFTSLTGNSAFIANQKLGYDSYWMDTLSNGGNLLVDAVMGHKYIITDKPNDYYKTIKKYDGFYLEESNLPFSFGYLTDDMIDISNTKNSFEVSNVIANSLFGEAIFDIQDLEKIDKTLEKTISINDEKAVYLEVSNGYINSVKQKIYRSFNIYINDELVYENYPNKDNVNAIYLGTYKNDIKVRIEKLKDVDTNYMVLATVNPNKVREELFNHTDEIYINYKKGKINIIVNNVKNKKYVFIPINYLDGMNAKNNGNKVEIKKAMNNYILIPLEEGMNEITISYQTPGLKIGILLSFVGLIGSIIYFKFFKRIEYYWVKNIGYILFYIVFTIMIILLYIIPFCGFILSFII